MDAQQLGESIRARRRVLDATQEEVALLAGVSTVTLSQIERGKPTARLDGILAVLRVLGLEIDLRVSDR